MNQPKPNPNSFSPLMDPLLLNSQMIQTAPPGGSLWEKASKWNWTKIIIHLVPICVFIFILFHFKSKYEKKRALLDEYLVFD